MKKVCLLALLVLLVGCQTTAMRGVQGNTFYSERGPSATIQLPETFQYLGEVEFNYPERIDTSQTTVRTKSYVFVEPGENNTVETVGFIKYEKLPTKWYWYPDVFGKVKSLDRSFYEIDGVSYHRVLCTGDLDQEIARKVDRSKFIVPNKFLFLALGKVLKKNEKVYLIYGKPYDDTKYFTLSESLTAADSEFIETFQKEIDAKIRISEYVPVQ